MGCICKNNKQELIIETKNEYKNEFINNETNINENNNQIDDEINNNEKKVIQEEEIDTTILGYPELALNLINKIRQNPKHYAKIIEEEINNIIVEKNEYYPKKNKIIYKNKIKVALGKGESAFREAIEELKNMEPMEPLILRNENCLTLPDDMEDYDNPHFLKDKVKEKSENNIHINIFYKERVSDPEISVLLMIVDDRNKKDSGKKRKAILNKDYKYIGITSKYIDDNFISYYSFSKS